MSQGTNITSQNSKLLVSPIQKVKKVLLFLSSAALSFSLYFCHPADLKKTGSDSTGTLKTASYLEF